MKKFLVLACVLSIFLAPYSVEARQPDYCPGIWENINDAIRDSNFEAFAFWTGVYFELC